MPETQLAPFVAMMPRLLAEEQMELLNALIVTEGRRVKEEHHGRYMDEIHARIAGHAAEKRRAPRAHSLQEINRYGADFIRVIREDRVAVSSMTTSQPGDRPGQKKTRREVNMNG